MKGHVCELSSQCGDPITGVELLPEEQGDQAPPWVPTVLETFPKKLSAHRVRLGKSLGVHTGRAIGNRDSSLKDKRYITWSKKQQFETCLNYMGRRFTNFRACAGGAEIGTFFGSIGESHFSHLSLAGASLGTFHLPY